MIRHITDGLEIPSGYSDESDEEKIKMGKVYACKMFFFFKYKSFATQTRKKVMVYFENYLSNFNRTSTDG